MSAVERVVTWEETEDPFAKAAALFPASGGTLAVEPSTAYDDVERLLAGAPGLEARLGGRRLFGALRMVKSRRGDRDDPAGDRGRAAPLPPRLRGAEARAASRRRSRRSSAARTWSSSARPRRCPHGASGSTPLARDQAVLIDAWDKPDGYYYDITRSTFYGTPTDEYRKVWSIVLDAQSAAIDKAAPGVPCFEVDAAARRVIEKAGYGEYFTHRLGHGLGIDVHEPPYMVGHDRTILEPGMTFTSEPGHLPAGPLRRAHRGRHRLHRARRRIALAAGLAARADRRRSVERGSRPGFAPAPGPGPEGTCRGVIVFSLAHDLSIWQPHCSTPRAGR